MTDEHAIVDAETVEIQPRQTDDGDVLHPMVRAMMSRPDFGPEEMGKMMALQERWERGQAEKAYHAARSRLLADLPPIIKKNKHVAFNATRYSYADLPQIMRSVMPALERHGFSLSWRNNGDGRTESVTCIITHCGGHSESNTRSVPVEQKKGMSAVQSAQATVTYLQRQALAALLGVVTDDMPDADERRPASSPDHVDAARNLRALTRLRKEHGISADDAEAELGKPVAEWTRADLAKIPEWLERREGC